MGVTSAEVICALALLWALVRLLGGFQRRLEGWILGKLGRRGGGDVFDVDKED